MKFFPRYTVRTDARGKHGFAVVEDHVTGDDAEVFTGPDATEQAEAAVARLTTEATVATGNVIERTIAAAPVDAGTVHAAMAPTTARITVLIPESAMPDVHAAAERTLHAEVFGDLGDLSPLRAGCVAVAATRPDINDSLPVRCRRRLEPPHARHEAGCPATAADVERRGLSAYLDPQPRAGVGDLVSGVPVADHEAAILGVVVGVVAPPAGSLDHRYDVQTAYLLPTGRAAVVRVHGGVLRIAVADAPVVCFTEVGHGAHGTPALAMACAIAHARAAVEQAAGQLHDGEANR